MQLLKDIKIVLPPGAPRLPDFAPDCLIACLLAAYQIATSQHTGSAPSNRQQSGSIATAPLAYQLVPEAANYFTFAD